MNMKRTTQFSLILIGLSACYTSQEAVVTQIAPIEARDLIAKGDAELVVLDVRTPVEFNAGHLPGAININVLSEDFEMNVAELDRDQPILVYCRSGNRSAQAVEKMLPLGFRRVRELKSGWNGWVALVATPEIELEGDSHD